MPKRQLPEIIISRDAFVNKEIIISPGVPGYYKVCYYHTTALLGGCPLSPGNRIMCVLSLLEATPNIILRIMSPLLWREACFGLICWRHVSSTFWQHHSDVSLMKWNVNEQVVSHPCWGSSTNHHLENLSQKQGIYS